MKFVHRLTDAVVRDPGGQVALGTHGIIAGLYRRDKW